MINAVRECGVALNILYPRYFPPPSSAPGGCSCQIGNLYGTIRDSSPLAIRCQIYIGELRDDGQLTGSQHDQDLMDCSCCAASRAISEYVLKTCTATCTTREADTETAIDSQPSARQQTLQASHSSTGARHTRTQCQQFSRRRASTLFHSRSTALPNH